MITINSRVVSTGSHGHEEGKRDGWRRRRRKLYALALIDLPHSRV